MEHRRLAENELADLYREAGLGELSILEHLYDRHPIREETLRESLGPAKHDFSHTDPAELASAGVYDGVLGDQDHFGGAKASEELAELAAVGPADEVLDICCGLGGPARYLAWKYGCRVHGLDFSRTRIESGRRICRAMGLSHLVRLHLGNALDLPFPDETFDVAWGQGSWFHVPDKARLLAEASRTLKPGGRLAFEDHLVAETASAEDLAFYRAMLPAAYETFAGYHRLLEQAGLCVLHESDQSAVLLNDIRRMIRHRLECVPKLLESEGTAAFLRRWNMWGTWLALAEKGVALNGRFLAVKATT